MSLKPVGFLLTWVISSAIATAGRGDQGTLKVSPPPLQREFRGTWIATVANRNWPSQPGLSTAEQKAELRDILDRAARLKLNAVIFQVRPACDAFYASLLEPWSEYLTGQMGRAPEPFYDPLAFALDEAHQRGLELHAWFNPFRARYNGAKSPPPSNHISRTQPELVRKYGQYLWLDPGDPAVQRHSQAVILDVVKRYDIDAVHLDDYFYPYPEKSAADKPLDFPDETSWNRFRANGGTLSRGDWRRKNVDDFVQALYRGIKAQKPWVKFGISPFGIWRPGHPKDVTGLDAYDQIYADARKWLANGWADYFVPQLYWPIQSNGQSYRQLLKWWVDQNAKGRHLWPGNNANKVGANWPAEEIVSQIRLTRKQTGATGNVLWSVASFTQISNGLAQALAKNVYAQPALVPASPWLDNLPPSQPRVRFQGSSATKEILLSWEATGSERAWLWVLQSRMGDRWITEILPGHVNTRSLQAGRSSRLPDYIAVTAVDRCGNTSPAAIEAVKLATPTTRAIKKR